MARCGCQLSEFDVAFPFFFPPTQHHLRTQRSHTNDPSSTNNHHFNGNTLLVARTFGVRLLARVLDARNPVSRVMLLAADQPVCSLLAALPAPLSTYSQFIATPTFACLLIHVRGTCYYILIKQMITSPKFYAFRRKTQPDISSRTSSTRMRICNQLTRWSTTLNP